MGRIVHIPHLQFRYLTPREGTKTIIVVIVVHSFLVQIPYSPRGDENEIKEISSDHLFVFRYLTPREGTKTRLSQSDNHIHNVQIPYSPRGDENNHS